MKCAFKHWANLEAARDDSSINLNYEDSVKTLIMAAGGVETYVFQNTIFPDSASIGCSFSTSGRRIFKSIITLNLIQIILIVQT